ncbi:MAG: hypothetical protein AABX11_00685 [Nanoarchaeota archaeon]
MAWKDLPYWLKGGIVGGLVDILLLVFAFITSSLDAYGIIFQWFLMIFLFPILIGVLISWIFGKIARKK